MKKTLFMFIIVIFLGSCSGEFDDVVYTITNDSSKTVSFAFNDILETLDTGGSITYNINSEKGRVFPEIDFTGHHPKSISLKTSNKGTAGIFYTFSDNTPLNLDVTNMLSIPVTITADNYIDNAGEFTIKIEEKGNKTALIYTSIPSFSVQESDESERTLDPVETGIYIPYPYPYPITFVWGLNDNTINLTIK